MTASSAWLVRPATAAEWPGLGNVFASRANNPDSCWCQRFRRHQQTNNRAALHAEISTNPTPIGLLAFPREDDRPVGWTRVVPRSSLPGIVGNRAISRIVADQPDGWWVSCFVVRREHRGTGVGVALLQAAVRWAAQQGGGVLDGHPVDVSRLAGTPAPSALFTGTLDMFTQTGFIEIGRTFPSRPVMRHILHGT